MKDPELTSFTITAIGLVGALPMVAVARIPGGKSLGVYSPRKAWPASMTDFDVRNAPLSEE